MRTSFSAIFECSLATKLLTKGAKKFLTFWVNLKKHNFFLAKIAVATFGTTLEILGYF